MIQRVVYQLPHEDLDAAKARAQTVASSTGLNTVVVARRRLAWGLMPQPKGWYAPDGTYTEWTA